MEALTKLVGDLNSIVWGVPMLILILGFGLYLTFGLPECSRLPPLAL